MFVKKPISFRQEAVFDIAMDQERRFSPRVLLPYPARLWVRDRTGRRWKEDVVIENLSAGGLYLYLRLNRFFLRKGARIAVAVLLSTSPARRTPVLRLSARGFVLRMEPLNDGTCGVALEFTRRRVW
jgi:hypothetical protein